MGQGGRRRSPTSVKVSGGSLEAFYYAFGGEDVYAILNLPDNVSAATASMTVTASGIGRPKIVVLITPEEMNEVSRKHAEYRPPGAA